MTVGDSHDCRQSAAMISDLASGEDVPGGMCAAAEVCAGCPQCSRMLNDFRAMRSRLRAVNASVHAPPGLWDRLLAGLDRVDEGASRPRSSLRARASWAAALLLLAVIGWALKIQSDARPFDAAGLVDRQTGARVEHKLDTNNPERAGRWASQSLRAPIPPVPDRLTGFVLESVSETSWDGVAGVVFAYRQGARRLRYYHFVSGKRTVSGQFSACPDGPQLLWRQGSGDRLVAWQYLDRTCVLVGPLHPQQLQQAVLAIWQPARQH